jgi:branched-chain amino acid transport system substrate-binding protein
MNQSRLVRSLMVVVAALLAAPALHAQIKIGQTAGFSGIAAAGVKEAFDGAKLYIDAVNASGGIGGRNIDIVSMDDKFEPKLAAENAKKLIDQGVIALFLTRGTPHNQAILPLLSEHRVPLIGPSTGAMVLHQPVNPWVFNVRASYQREAERAVQHLQLIGMGRIAILQVDDSFGADATTGALKGFAAIAKEPVLNEKFDRAKPDFAPLVAKVMKSNAQAVLFFGSGNAVIDGVAQLRAAGSAAQVVTLSNNASAGFIKGLGRNAHGVVVCQVFPSERNLATPLIKEAMELGKAKGVTELTPAMLEGFASAKVLVEALRRAGKDLTRAGVQKALEGFRRVDIGGMEVTYSSSDHTGLDYADLSIIGPDGRFRR